MNVTLQSLHSAYKKLGYPTNPKFNLGAIRAKEQFTNRFDDLVFYFNDKDFLCFEGTVDSGLLPLKDGIASMKAGFYPKLYGFGNHKNNPEHPCFKQIAPAEYYRSKGGQQFPPDSIFKEKIGTNIHSTREDWTPQQVNDFSKGCIVVRRWKSMERLLEIAHQSGFKVFDFALLREKDLG